MAGFDPGIKWITYCGDESSLDTSGSWQLDSYSELHCVVRPLFVRSPSMFGRRAELLLQNTLPDRPLRLPPR